MRREGGGHGLGSRTSRLIVESGRICIYIHSTLLTIAVVAPAAM